MNNTISDVRCTLWKIVPWDRERTATLEHKEEGTSQALPGLTHIRQKQERGTPPPSATSRGSECAIVHGKSALKTKKTVKRKRKTLPSLNKGKIFSRPITKVSPCQKPEARIPEGGHGVLLLNQTESPVYPASKQKDSPLSGGL